MTLDELIEESTEALLRYYSTYYYTGKENPTYLEAHEHNVLEAYARYGVNVTIFHTHLVAHLCKQIVAQNDYDE